MAAKEINIEELSDDELRLELQSLALDITGTREELITRCRKAKEDDIIVQLSQEMNAKQTDKLDPEKLGNYRENKDILEEDNGGDDSVRGIKSPDESKPTAFDKQIDLALSEQLRKKWQTERGKEEALKTPGPLGSVFYPPPQAPYQTPPGYPNPYANPYLNLYASPYTPYAPHYPSHPTYIPPYGGGIDQTPPPSAHLSPQVTAPLSTGAIPKQMQSLTQPHQTPTPAKDTLERESGNDEMKKEERVRNLPPEKNEERREERTPRVGGGEKYPRLSCRDTLLSHSIIILCVTPHFHIPFLKVTRSLRATRHPGEEMWREGTKALGTKTIIRVRSTELLNKRNTGGLNSEENPPKTPVNF